MPVPRTAILAGDLTTWLVVGAPGLILGLLVAVLRFDLALHVSWLAVPAMLLVALTTTTAGLAIVYAATPPVTNMVTQPIVFIALMFSPINYPPDRLPRWLQAIHQALPFEYMARAIRDTPADGIAILPFAVLAAWCTAHHAGDDRAKLNTDNRPERRCLVGIIANLAYRGLWSDRTLVWRHTLSFPWGTTTTSRSR